MKAEAAAAVSGGARKRRRVNTPAGGGGTNPCAASAAVKTATHPVSAEARRSPERRRLLQTPENARQREHAAALPTPTPLALGSAERLPLAPLWRQPTTTTATTAGGKEAKEDAVDADLVTPRSVSCASGGRSVRWSDQLPSACVDAAAAAAAPSLPSRLRLSGSPKLPVAVQEVQKVPDTPPGADNARTRAAAAAAGDNVDEVPDTPSSAGDDERTDDTVAPRRTLVRPAAAVATRAAAAATTAAAVTPTGNVRATTTAMRLAGGRTPAAGSPARRGALLAMSSVDQATMDVAKANCGALKGMSLMAEGQTAKATHLVRLLSSRRHRVCTPCRERCGLSLSALPSRQRSLSLTVPAVPLRRLRCWARRNAR
jgi:hypothetical protein